MYDYEAVVDFITVNDLKKFIFIFHVKYTSDKFREIINSPVCEFTREKSFSETVFCVFMLLYVGQRTSSVTR